MDMLLDIILSTLPVFENAAINTGLETWVGLAFATTAICCLVYIPAALEMALSRKGDRLFKGMIKLTAVINLTFVAFPFSIAIIWWLIKNPVQPHPISHSN